MSAYFWNYESGPPIRVTVWEREFDCFVIPGDTIRLNGHGYELQRSIEIYTVAIIRAMRNEGMSVRYEDIVWRTREESIARTARLIFDKNRPLGSTSVLWQKVGF